jgi:hypothetical protein
VLEGVSHFSLPLRCRERMLSHGVAPLLQQHACNTAKRKREWFGIIRVHFPFMTGTVRQDAELVGNPATCLTHNRM